MNNASRGQNTLRVYTILLQGKQPKQQLRQDNSATCFPARVVVKSCIGCICCFLFIPLIPPYFRMILFLCEKIRGLLRALPWNILLVLNSDFYFFTFLFSKLALGPILLMMINVSINDD